MDRFNIYSLVFHRGKYFAKFSSQTGNFVRETGLKVLMKVTSVTSFKSICRQIFFYLIVNQRVARKNVP
jgi:hypothetical protein